MKNNNFILSMLKFHEYSLKNKNNLKFFYFYYKNLIIWIRLKENIIIINLFIFNIININLWIRLKNKLTRIK